MKKFITVLFVIICLLLCTSYVEAKNIDFTGAYFYGYNDYTAAGDQYITREEASAMMYRILKQSDNLKNISSDIDIKDISSFNWSEKAIRYMVNIGALDLDNGYSYPYRTITRSEIAKLMVLSCTIEKHNGKTYFFNDLNSWAKNYEYVDILVTNEILKGYPDYSIRPDNYLTRSEFVTIVNRIIKRNHKYEIPTEYGFNDIDESYWAFAEILRANSAYEYRKGKYYVNNDLRLDRNQLDEYLK